MQDYQINNDLITSESLMSMTIKNYPQDSIRQNSFLNGLQNARNILNDLQKSIQETKKYEIQLLRCRSSHAHLHKPQEWSDSEHELNDKKCSQGACAFDVNQFEYHNSEKLDNGVAAESWSAMSIVCLQYQYEELSKRYKSLLDEYKERCGATEIKDRQMKQLQEVANATHAQLMEAHTALLAIGEKYMTLKHRKHALKHLYSRKVHRLKKAVTELIAAADLSRQELDARLEKAMRTERHGGAALLLAEIRKCNHLCLENLRLKAQIQELLPKRHISGDYKTY